MLYIKLTKDYLEEFEENSKLSDFSKRVIYFFRRWTGRFGVYKIENGEIITFSKLNKKLLKNLKNYLKIYGVNKVVLSENLKQPEVMDTLNNLKIKTLDGKWLKKFLCLDIVEYIVAKSNSDIKFQEISILSQKITEIEIELIENLAIKAKVINVITNEKSKLKRLEERLYKEKGIIINVTTNFNKALAKSNFIINFDFDEELLNKFTIYRKAVIINLFKNVSILKKGFDGINICDCTIYTPKKIKQRTLDTLNFNKEILYESVIYKNTNPKNIVKEIKKDKIKIESLIGMKGKIRMQEFLRLENGRKTQKLLDKSLK